MFSEPGCGRKNLLKQIDEAFRRNLVRIIFRRPECYRKVARSCFKQGFKQRIINIRLAISKRSQDGVRSTKASDKATWILFKPHGIFKCPYKFICFTIQRPHMVHVRTICKNCLIQFISYPFILQAAIVVLP